MIRAHSPLRIIVTGATGQLGFELVRALSPMGHIVPLAREDFDFEHPDRLRDLVRGINPDVIVNAAAYTAVDVAEADGPACFRANAAGPAVLAEEAKRLGALLVHYSTAFVFDGTQSRPYTEDDEPNPASVYARSKLEGERAIRTAEAAHVILRTNWIFGTRRPNFFQTVKDLAKAGGDLHIISDQIGAPTWSRMIAAATGTIIGSMGKDRVSVSESALARGGLFHMTATGEASRHEFATAIVESMALGAASPRVHPMTTEAYRAPAPRPLNSILDCSKLESTFGVRLPPWREQLRLATQ